MASIPLPALGVQKQESPLSTYSQLQQIQGAQEQIKGQKLQNQEAQQAMQDQQKMTQAYIQAGGDQDKALQIAAASGVRFKTLQAVKSGLIEQKTKLATLDKDTLANMQSHLDLIGQASQAALSVPPEQRPQAVQQGLSQLVQHGVMKPEEAQAAYQQYQQQGDDYLKLHSLQAIKGKDQIDEAMKAKQEASQQATAAAELPGKQAESQMKVEEAGIPLQERKNMKASEASLALQSAQGDKTAEAALQRLDQSKRASRPVINNALGSTDVKDIADAIENGDQPPTLQGLYRNGAPVRAELARRGVPIAKMEMDWNATKKYISTLNGPQQTRLRQDISTVSDSLDKVEDLYNQWKQLAPQSGFKVLNKATLKAMENMPGKAGAIAHALESQIADTTAGLGTVYMGGNSPTDHGLNLASKALSADWNDDTFKEALKQARANVKIRTNSIMHAQPAGLSGESNYAPQNGGQQQQQAAPAQAQQGGAKADPLGIR